MKPKMRCNQCMWYNYDFLERNYESGKSFCGLHGSSPVDPNGAQINLLGADKFGCGFEPIELQLSLFKF